MPSTPRRAAIVVAAVLTAVTPVTCSSGDGAPPRAPSHVPQTAGVAIPSGSDIRVPPRALSAAKQGRAERPGAAGAPAGAEEGYSVPPTQPCRNEDEYRFPRGIQAELHVSPRVVRPGGFPYSRFRRRSLPRRRSPPQPSAHEHAAPYPAPSPPGTRPRGESP